jgi:hypothetical protein
MLQVTVLLSAMSSCLLRSVEVFVSQNLEIQETGYVPKVKEFAALFLALELLVASRASPRCLVAATSCHRPNFICWAEQGRMMAL